MNESLEMITNRLATSMEERLKEDTDVNEIWSTVEKIKTTREKFQKFKGQMNEYNRAVDRIRALQNINEGIKKNYPFTTNEAVDAYVDTVVNQAGNEFFRHYKDTQLNVDKALILSLNEKLEDIGIEGYSSIMKLRELLTGQTIIYAIQGLGSKTDSRIQAYIEEDEYLKLLKSKPRYNVAADLKHMKIDSSSRASTLQVDYAGITQIPGVEAHSRDPLYKKITKYLNRSAKEEAVKKATEDLEKAKTEKTRESAQKRFDKAGGKKARESDLWEAYTEAKRAVGDNPSDDALHDFLGKWLALKQETFLRITSTGTITASISTLAFYQGGDTTTFSKYVSIQNKSSSFFMEAGVNLATVYNVLGYITEAFPSTRNIDVNQVKALFTATGLSDVPRNIATEGFLIANEFAQEQIEKHVAMLNMS